VPPSISSSRGGPPLRGKQDAAGGQLRVRKPIDGCNGSMPQEAGDGYRTDRPLEEVVDAVEVLA
jgi:hypothetical protein